MKNLNRVLASLLAVMMLLGCAAAEENTENDPVLYTINGLEVYKSEVDATLQDMVYNSYVNSLADYDTAIEYLIQLKLINDKIAEMGLDQFTEEEEQAFLNEAQAEWDEAINEYVDYFLAEDTDEAREQAKKDAEAYYAVYGYSIEEIIDNLKWNDSYEKLQAACVTVTDEDIQAEFEAAVAYYKSTFENDIGTYEYYKEFYGYEMLYTPEGYRGITHILLKVDEELLSAYTEAQAAMEEEPAEGTEPVTQADVDAAKEAILASCKTEIDEIYARLEAGESFESLIAAYGTDPGMQDETYLKNGYAVHQDSIVWDPVFTAGAFSEKMQKPGDVSDPVIGSYGIHILYYLRDIPSGAIELDDELRAELENSVKSEKFFTELTGWMENAVVYNQEAIDAAKAEATAAEQAALAEEESPEAAPAE